MKKLLLFSVVHIIAWMGLAHFISHDLFAQIPLENKQWDVLAEDTDWLETSDHTTRGIAFNPETGNILVATRTDGTAIQLLNGEDGSAAGQLDVTGVEGGFFPINRVAVTEDGQIFVANFSLNGPEFRIYYWENEGAAPERVFDGDPYNNRIGDGFGVTGSGDEVYVYTSGTFQDQLVEFFWNGEELSEPEFIDLPGEDHANASIVAAPDEDALWINGRDASILKINRDGEVLAEIGEDIISEGNGELDVLELEDRVLLSTGVMSTDDNRFSLIDVTEEDTPFLLAQTPDLTTNTNDFRIGGTAFDRENKTLTVFAAHSSITQFSVTADELLTDELLGYYHIPKGDHSRGFDSLKEALDSLNSSGIIGAVTFIIDDDLDEAGEILRIDRDDLTENTPLKIRTGGEGNTIQAAELRIVDSHHITIDGAVDNNTQPGLTFLKNGGSGSAISILSDTEEVTIRNLKIVYSQDFGEESSAIVINRREGEEDTGRSKNLNISDVTVGSSDKPFRDAIWLFGSTTNDDYRHENVVLSNNKFYASRSALRTQNHINTVFENNKVFLYPTEEAQGLNLNTPIDAFTLRNNKFEIVAGNVTDPADFIGLNITNTLVEADFYNNTFAINYDGNGTDHSFYVIRHAGDGTTGPLNFYHNTIRIDETGQSGIHAVLGSTEEASDGAELNFVNNIMVNERDAGNSYIYDWNSGNLNASYNNVYTLGDGATGRLGEDVYEDLADWQEASGVDANSVSVETEFVSNSDLRLTGGSIGDINLAGTPIRNVTTDIDGSLRDTENPYMGAFEGDETLVPEPGILAFNLLSPQSEKNYDLTEYQEDIEFSWELPVSTLAWSRENGRFLDDNFSHIGDGNTGPGKYLGTDLDVEDAALITPLLPSPGTLDFWASAHSIDTNLELVVEYADYNSRLDDDWQTLETFTAEEGGSGDINIEWTNLKVEVDSNDDVYIRFRQTGEVSESFYIDDIEVSASNGSEQMVLSEDFEAYDEFPAMKFEWHLDDAGNFSESAYSRETDESGEGLSLTISDNEINEILSDMGLEEGDIFNGSWTVSAEFGEWEKFANESYTITIVRGSEVSADPGEQPYEFALNQNFPNPFNATTTIEFALPESSEVKLEVYNMVGQRVKTLIDGKRGRGEHNVSFNASSLASGVYVYRIIAGEYTEVKQMTLVK